MEENIFYYFKKIQEDAEANKFNNKQGKKVGNKIEEEFNRVKGDMKELVEKKQQYIEARRKNREDNERRAMLRKKKLESQRKSQAKEDDSKSNSQNSGSDGKNNPGKGNNAGSNSQVQMNDKTTDQENKVSGANSQDSKNDKPKSPPGNNGMQDVSFNNERKNSDDK